MLTAAHRRIHGEATAPVASRRPDYPDGGSPFGGGPFGGGPGGSGGGSEEKAHAARLAEVRGGVQGRRFVYHRDRSLPRHEALRRRPVAALRPPCGGGLRPSCGGGQS